MPSSARVIDAARVILIFRHGFAQPHPSCDRFEPAELNRDEFPNLELPCRILVDDSQQLYFFRSHRQNQASPWLELLLVFYERASGARMHANYFRVGGVHQDLPPKLLDDIWDFCDPFLKVCDNLEGLLTDNRIFKQRNVDTGLISLDDAWAWGFSGVMVRGSGAAWDLRKAQPYECYPEMDFDIPVGKNGDCYDRYLVRMEEMRQSVRIMKQCLGKLRHRKAGAGHTSKSKDHATVACRDETLDGSDDPSFQTLHGRASRARRRGIRCGRSTEG